MKNKHLLIISLIFLTTVPFLWFISEINFKLYSKNPDFFWSETSLLLGNVLGIIGGILLFWEFIIGIRPIMKYLSSDLPYLTKIHGWVGKYGLLLVFIHPLLTMYAYAEELLWIFLPDFKTPLETSVTWGRLAFILFIIIYVTSALVREKIKYRPWLYIHFLSYPLMGLTLLHALDIGSFLNKYILLKNLWYALCITFIFFAIYRIFLFAGFGSRKYKLTRKENTTDDLISLVFTPIQKAFIPRPGQYFYIQTRLFAESHPFTIMEYDEQNGEITFGIKVQGWFTSQLNSLEIGSEILLEGPYGEFTQEGQNNENRVVIAGGIGVTPFVELARRFPENLFFINCNRKMHEVMLRAKIKNYIGKNYFDCLSQEEMQDENIMCGHLDSDAIKKILGEEKIKISKFFICGSKRFNDGMEANLKALNVNPEKIFIESFY